jgi:peptide subunit release factor 1 (eRF1)
MSTALSPDLRDSLLTELRRRTTTPGFHFLDAQHLSDLSEIESTQAPVVSLFMDLTPEMRAGDGWQIAFKDLSRQTLDSLNGTFDANQVKRELQRVEEALHQGLPRTGRGVAFYSCQEIGLFRQFGLAIETATMSYVDHRPYVRPLVRLRDEHDRFGIVLLSQKQLRFFFSQIGLVEEVFELEGREILTADYQSKDQRQDKQAEYRRDQARRAAHAVQLLAEELDVRHIIYSAPSDMEGTFLDALEQATRNRVAASFACDIHATPAEVAAKAEPVQREVEEREELETIALASDLLTTRSVAGLDETVEMLNQQRVQTLILDDELTFSGGIDRETGMLSLRNSGTHESTGNDISPQDDLFEPMVERALAQGASIEFVRSVTARTKLQALGPCAAILRF